MIENNLFNSGFLGRDGFRWWIGQIPPRTSWSLTGNRKPDAWGNRVKVRIMGYHPQNKTELKDKDLPWATVILPTNNGSGKAAFKKPIRVNQGDIVVGFFLDGDDAQQPVIFGVIGNSKYVVNKKGDNPFTPMSGFTPDNKPEGKRITEKGSEINDDSTDTIQPVLDLEKDKTEKLTKETGIEHRSTSDVIGHCVANAGTDATSEMKSSIKNLSNQVKNSSAGSKFGLISSASKQIKNVSSKFTQGMTKGAFTSLAPALNGGLDGMYNKVYTSTLLATKNTAIAKKFGTAAITAMVPNIDALASKLSCVNEALGKDLLPDINSLLTNFVDNVENPTDCMAEQVTGAIFNKIVNGIGGNLAPELGGVSKILGGFDLVNDLRGKAEGLFGVQQALDCVKPQTSDNPAAIWCLGKGPMNMPGVAAEKIMSIANAAQSLQEAAGAPGGILGELGVFDFMNPNVSSPNYGGECSAEPPQNCNGVQVKVFGGDGQGVEAEPIIGDAVGVGTQRTGSLIGVKLNNTGSGFSEPPEVEITDNCNQGYGANARAIIDYDPSSPTYQQVTDIYVVTSGENYPIIEENTDEKTYVVDHVVVINPGQNYTNDDIITDNVGNVYEKILDTNGRILNVIPPNAKLDNVLPVIGFPVLNIETSNGYGAIIRPQIAPRPDYQGEIKQVIDCITPRDGLIGFVNGDPYYGPFHVHPTRGVKMVGAAHTTSPHSIIYDTPAESRSSLRTVSSTSTTINKQITSTSQSTPSNEPVTPIEMTDTPTTTTSNDSYQAPPSSPPSNPPSSPPPSSPPPSSPPSGGGGGGYGY